MKKILTVLVLLLLLSAALNVWQWKAKREKIVTKTKTEYIIRTDTVPVPSETKPTGDTLVVRVPVIRHTTDTMYMPGSDSATVALPVEQNIYKDSLYTAWVSGYRAKLDSISLRIPHTTTTIERTISGKAPRLSVGPTLGVGYGVVNRTPDVFVGIAVTWRIWK